MNHPWVVPCPARPTARAARAGSGDGPPRGGGVAGLVHDREDLDPVVAAVGDEEPATGNTQSRRVAQKTLFPPHRRLARQKRAVALEDDDPTAALVGEKEVARAIGHDGGRKSAVVGETVGQGRQRGVALSRRQDPAVHAVDGIDDPRRVDREVRQALDHGGDQPDGAARTAATGAAVATLAARTAGATGPAGAGLVGSFLPWPAVDATATGRSGEPVASSRIEAGRPCRLDTKRKILMALGLKVSDKDKVFGPSPTASPEAPQVGESFQAERAEV